MGGTPSSFSGRPHPLSDFLWEGVGAGGTPYSPSEGTPILLQISRGVGGGHPHPPLEGTLTLWIFSGPNDESSSPVLPLDPTMVAIPCSPAVCVSNRMDAGVPSSARRAARFRPCIDIHKGKVKQIAWSSPKDSNKSNDTYVTNFETDKSPAEYANLFKNDGLTGGQVMMLDVDTSSQSAAIEALHAYPGGLQVGGGININLENALSFLEEGASHVIVALFSDGKMDVERLRNLANVTGKNRLVLELSCRKKNGRYAIVPDRWQKDSDVFLDEETLCLLSTYANELLVHALDVEGKRSGIDEELVSLLGRISPIPVTYAGGVATVADMERIQAAGKGGVDGAIFSALDIFGGNLPYKDVVAWHKKQQVMVAQ